MPTATHATVSINSIRVVDSSVNTTSEPGSSAEWRLTFIVNGQAATWARDDVKDNTVYSLAMQFPHVPIGPQGMISIQVSGYEHDSTSANDPLPLLQVTTSPADDFLLGGTRWSNLAQSDEGSYMIEYSIRPSITQALTVARQYVAAFGRSLFDHVVLDDLNFGIGQRFDRRRVFRAAAAARSVQSPIFAATWDPFVAHWQQQSGSGNRLVRLSSFLQDTGVVTFGDTTERVFLGTFEPGTDRYGLWVSRWRDFEAKWKDWSEQGLRLVDLATYEDGRDILFAGVFREGQDGYALWVGDWPAFEAKWQELSGQNLRLVAIDTFVEGGARKFAGVYRAGSDGYALWAGSDWTGFEAKTAEFRGQGLHLVDLAAYVDGSQQRFTGVYRADSRRSTLFLGDLAALEAEINAQLGRLGWLATVDTYVPGAEG